MVAGDFNSISDACCAHYNFNNLGGISAMNYGLKKGMVLTMGMAGYPENRPRKDAELPGLEKVENLI